jgi:hypothetical protein
MQEVIARLQFIRPALGYAERRARSEQVVYTWPRDPQQRLMFLSSWWHERMNYAAKVLSRYSALVAQISWDQAIGYDGNISQFRRDVWREKQGCMVRSGYAEHEAIRAGAEITVRAVLPSNLPLEAFRELLDIVGRYKGISPYRSDTEAYGTFAVLTVQPVMRVVADHAVEGTQCKSSSAAAEP